MTEKSVREDRDPAAVELALRLSREYHETKERLRVAARNYTTCAAGPSGGIGHYAEYLLTLAEHVDVVREIEEAVGCLLPPYISDIASGVISLKLLETE